MIETVKGSSTPNVSGGRLSAGSGRFSHSSRWPCSAYVTTNAPTTCTMQMTRRARSSPRCSTSCASSPWRRRRGSRFIASVGGGRRVVRCGPRQLRLVVVLAGDRVLEFAHPASKRAADLGQALRPEDEERDDEDDDEPRDSDLRHAFSLARPGIAGIWSRRKS